MGTKRKAATRCSARSTETPGQDIASTLFVADNLRVLRGIDTATIDLIATDPPFNKSRDFHATPDSLAAGAKFVDRWRWDKDVHQDWLESLKNDRPAVLAYLEAVRKVSGDDMGAFLCWLGVRLMECHRVLKPTGSLYLHIDHTAHAYVKGMLDAVFGRRQFRNAIAWCYTGPGNTKHWFPRKHDTILFYVKSKDALFHADAVRVPYAEATLQRRRYSEGKSGITGGYSEGRSEEEVTGEFSNGKVPEDWWTGIGAGGAIPRAERTGYPTQKPVALYQRMILASSLPGDLVLDPFCGCATTLLAAHRLRRRWCGIDIWDGAQRLVRERLRTDGEPTGSRRCRPRALGMVEVRVSRKAPRRTDEGETAVEDFELQPVRNLERWERLRPAEIRARLLEAQREPRAGLGNAARIVCAGCGRRLEEPFMEVDHRTPKREGGVNTIDNRVLLCGPCNGRKGAALTLFGLHRANRKEGWMQDTARAKEADGKARRCAERAKRERQ